MKIQLSPAVIPPFFTYPEILLKIGRGGKSEDTPRSLKDSAISLALDMLRQVKICLSNRRIVFFSLK